MVQYWNRDLGANLNPRPDWYPPLPGLIVLIGHEYERPPTVRPAWYPLELFAVEILTCLQTGSFRHRYWPGTIVQMCRMY